MPRVRLPRPIPPLPLVCVMTGQRVGVELHHVRLVRARDAAIWLIVGGLCLCGPIGGAAGALVNEALFPFQVWLPFSEEGLDAFRRTRLIRGASLVASIVLTLAAAIGPLMQHGRLDDATKLLAFAAFMLLPLPVWWFLVRRRVPELHLDRHDHLELWIPSEEAAAAITGN